MQDSKHSQQLPVHSITKISPAQLCLILENQLSLEVIVSSFLMTNPIVMDLRNPLHCKNQDKAKDIPKVNLQLGMAQYKLSVALLPML